MAKHQFALEPGAPKRVEVSYGLWFKDIEVKVDGKVVASGSGKTDLTHGLFATLEDGSGLEVKLEQTFINTQLSVRLNGVPLPGSATDPATQLRNAAYFMYLIAAINGVVGLALLVGRAETAEEIGGAIGQLVYAVVFAVLGFFAMKQSFVAAVLAVVLYAADAVVTLIDQAQSGRNNFGFLIIRGFLMMMMVRGAMAARELRARRKEEAAAPRAAA